MKCTKCGMTLAEGQAFCPNCGTKVDETNSNVMQNVSNQNEINNAPDMNNNLYRNYANSYNQNPNQVPNLNKNKAPWPLIIGIIIGVIVVIGIVFGVNQIMQNKNNNSSASSTTNNSQSTTSKTTTDTTTSTKTVDFSGYRFTYPSTCTASVSDIKMFIYGPNSKWVGAVIYQSTTSYSAVAAIKDQIKADLAAEQEAKTNGYDFTNAVTEEDTYGNMKFIVTKNIQATTYNLDITYADATQGIFVVSVTNADKSALTDTERNEIYKIVSTATKIS